MSRQRRERPAPAPAPSLPTAPGEAARQAGGPIEPARVRWAWWAAAALSFWPLGFNALRGSDVWWHIAAGREIVATWTLPRTDTWSFTAAGRRWLNHEWLTQAIFGLWERAWGIDALAWLEWILVVAALGALMSAMIRLLPPAPGRRLAAWAAAFASGLAAASFFEIRPHMFSLACLGLLFALVFGRERPSWWLPAVFAAWANLHAGSVFGIVALGVLLGLDAVRRRELFLRHLALGAACFAATLVNPDGLTTWLYTVRSTGKDPFIARLPEWQPAFDPAALYAPLFPWAVGVFLAAAAAALYGSAFRRSRWGLPTLVLAALTLAMALKACRFIPLFAVTGGLVLAAALGPLVSSGIGILQRHAPRLGSSRSRSGRTAAALLGPVLVAALGAGMLTRFPLSGAAFHHLTIEDTFPVDVCDFIETNHLSGRVFNYYGFGGYLTLRTGGRMKVFIDGRFNIVYENETGRRYLRVLDGEPDWREIIEGSGADYLLWPTTVNLPMLQNLVDSGRWRLIHQDYVAVLLCRTDRVPSRPLQLPPESPWRELARGGLARSEGRPAEAETHLRRALELKPDLRPASLTLASLLLDRGDRAAAEAVLERQQRAFPTYEIRDALEHVRKGLTMSGEPPGPSSPRNPTGPAPR